MKQRASCSLLAFALALPACADPEPGADFPELLDLTRAPRNIRTAAEAVVRVGTANGSGTGSFISATGRLMTNNHVAGATICPREGCWLDVTFDHQIGKAQRDPQTVFALPEHVDVGLDMAVLQLYDGAPTAGGKPLDTPSFLGFEAVDGPSLVGQHITIVGHPRGRLKKWSAGVVIDANGAWFESTNYILPGDSGSPALNDAGKIVGLIHRGTSSADELTEVSVNLSSLGTDAAALLQALAAPLPSVMVSTTADVTASYVLAYNEAYLNARVRTVSVEGVPTDVLTLFAEACDAALAAPDYTSPEALTAALAPCSDAQSWIDCRSDSGPSTAGVVCPSDDAERTAWAARYQAMNQRSVALNGQLDLSSLTFAISSLAATDAAGTAAGATSLQAALARTKPLRDFGLAPYLAAFDVETVATAKLIVDYEQVPYYYLYAQEIASAALWLGFQGALPQADTRRLLRKLDADPDVSVGAKLYIEDVRYSSGDL